MLAILLAGSATGYAENVPLPRPRPTDLGSTAATPAVTAPAGPASEGEAAPPSACQARLAGEGAVAEVLPPLVGPGGCGAPDVVRLAAVLLPDGRRVALMPPPTLRCTMAEAIAAWVRQDVAPAVAALGAPLAGIENYDSYDCRGRNRVVGAKLSEHGKANALDVRSLKLANGRAVELTDPVVSRDVRETLRRSACGRFKTVLGPGSDGYHESHIHVDLAERHNDYRICQWDVRVPHEEAPSAQAAGAESEAGAKAGAKAGADAAADVPLPRPRPPALSPPDARDATRQAHKH